MIEVNRIYTGDCIEVMKSWPENFVDTIITDPPYGIRFMGKAWDGEDIERTVERKRRKTTSRPDCQSLHDGRAFAAGTYDQSLSANQAFQEWCADWAAAALRIAKPGAVLLVFGGTRTFHRMTSGLEDAGWQIRDCLMWLYGSGFPKSLDISKAIDKRAGAEREVIGYKRQGPQSMFDGGKPRPATLPATLWHGWGTALKPAWEPIVVAMKPCDGTFAQNAEKWGVAGLNVDGGRIGTEELAAHGGGQNSIFVPAIPKGTNPHIGRWPANLILDEEAAGILDGQSGVTETHAMSRGHNEFGGAFGNGREVTTPNLQSSSGGASRFFYVAKAARSERNEGCEGMLQKPSGMVSENSGQHITRRNGDAPGPSANHHPTVKPLSLMKYLCNLTRTPTGGIVLDPFAGSGTTLWAAEYHNRPWLGIEMNPEYVAIANARIAGERAQMKMAI